jgi:hypothetical protein
MAQKNAPKSPLTEERDQTENSNRLNREKL